MKRHAVYVIDSSVIVKWITTHEENFIKHADQILLDARTNDTLLITPLLAKYEVGNAIKYKSFTIEEKITCLENLYHLPLQFVDTLFNEAITTIEIAHSFKITYYDGVFIALAKKLMCPLITANPKHQKKFPGVNVIPLNEYK